MSSGTSKTCPTCGLEIPPEAPAGLCAMCMLSLEDEPETVLVQPDLPEVPGYQLLALLGEGAFARVFHAQSTTDASMGVAVKVLKDTPFHTEGHARFRSEIAALKRLRHPSIAQIFDWGQTKDGHPFLAMELIDGMPLDRFIRRKKPDLTARLRLFLSLCEAVRHAHQSGILHRDLKPDNILVSQASGGGDPILKVIDLGIAKAMEEPLTVDAATTRMRMVIGTPGYMSPEQSAPGSRVDIRSDVYALGVLLHLMLTGKMPNAEPVDSGAAFHESEEPAKLPQDLGWIVDRATKEDPNERYQNTDSLASDIRRFIDGRPIEARPPSSFYQLTMWAGRHRAAAILSALLAIIVPSAAVVSTILYRQSESQRKQVTRALAQADFLVGAEAQSTGDHRRALAHFAAAVRSDPNHEAAVGQVLNTLALDPILRYAAPPIRLNKLGDLPTAMAVSPSGERVAITDGKVIALLDSMDDSTPEWIEHRETSPINVLALSEQTLAMGLEDGPILLRGHDGSIVHLTSMKTGGPWMIKFSADGSKLLAANGVSVAVFDVQSKKKLWQHDRPLIIQNLVTTPSLDHVVFVRERGRTRFLHHVRLTPAIAESEIPLRTPAASLAVSENGLLVGVGSLKEILVGRLYPGMAPNLRTIDIQNACTALTFSKDTRILVAATKDGNVRAWTVDSQAPVAANAQHLGGTKTVDYLDDSRQVLSISKDNHVRLWDLESGRGDHLAVTLEYAWVQYQPSGRTITAFDPNGLGLKRYTLGRNSLPIEFIEDTGWQALPRLTEKEMRGIRLSRNATFACRLPSGMIAVALNEGHLRFWAPSMSPMSPRMRLPGTLTGMATDPQQQHLLLRFVDGSVGRLPIAPTPPAPQWLATYAELAARARLRPDRGYVTPKGVAATPNGSDPIANFIREHCPH